MKSALKKIPGARALGISIKRLEARFVTYMWAFRDAHRYVRANHFRRVHHDRSFLRAEITKTYHSLEKGLSLASPRPDFGEGLAIRLARLIDDYLALHGDDAFIRTPIAAVGEYLDFKARHGSEMPMLSTFAARWGEGGLIDDRDVGGVVATSADEIRAASGQPFEQFLLARHSIRHFADRPVDPALLTEAGRLAQLCPSACNRQGARVYFSTERDKVQQILSLQGGNRGFGHTAPAVMVVTGRMAAFSGPEERSQALVDGSLFAMTLVYAAHSFGLGTCMLAWCVPPATERKLAEVVGLDEGDRVVMLIAVGHLPETLSVPVSRRYATGEAVVDVDHAV